MAIIENKIIIEVTPRQLRQLADWLEFEFNKISAGKLLPTIDFDTIPDGTKICLRFDQSSYEKENKQSKICSRCGREYNTQKSICQICSFSQ